MDQTIRRYTSLVEMKADEYRYWQSRPVWERMDAAEELIRTATPRRRMTRWPISAPRPGEFARRTSRIAPVFSFWTQ